MNTLVIIFILLIVLTVGSHAFLLRKVQTFSSSKRNLLWSNDDQTVHEKIAKTNNQDFAIDVQEKIRKTFSHISDIKLLKFSLTNHKPLGCSAEECLKVEDDGLKHVFVSSIVQGGNAEKAGISVGDVLVGVSGSFQDIEDVFGIGLGRVRSLIAGRPASQYLEIYILRGTDIQSKHDSALIDLCILPEDNDVIMGKCVKALYDASRDTLDSVDGVSQACTDQDTECMLDAIFRSWEDEEDMESKV